jgi:hypothetical protein
MTEFSGRELGRRIFAGIRSYIARSLGDIIARLELLERTVNSTPPVELMRAEWRADIDAAKAAFQDHTEPLTVESFRPMLEGDVAKWALDFERRAQAVLERAIDRLPTPKDGEDGAPGGSVDDFDVELVERNLTISMKIGDRVEKRTVRLDIPIERGVYQSGKTYEKSDIVTFSGSQFIATRDTVGTEKPEQSPAWRLIVKRGKDGRGVE